MSENYGYFHQDVILNDLAVYLGDYYGHEYYGRSFGLDYYYFRDLLDYYSDNYDEDFTSYLWNGLTQWAEISGKSTAIGGPVLETAKKALFYMGWLAGKGRSEDEAFVLESNPLLPICLRYRKSEAPVPPELYDAIEGRYNDVKEYDPNADMINDPQLAAFLGI